ncbi:MAG: glycosyltransferase family 2 protein [Chloroflexi bacterium]|nr:glycosyltransferase family 2 protein [Chloroflexota bacterium]
MTPEHQFRVGDPAPAPPPLRDEAAIVRDWALEEPGGPGEPLASILCPTYQHASFIDDAMRGFLGQRTTFPFEVLVRDDASTDGTRERVAEYQQRYPRIVRAVLEERNDWPRTLAIHVLLPLARGRYIAVCEGDDHWVDPDTLTRQVAVLETRRDCVTTHHQALVVRDGVIVATQKLPASRQRDLDAAELRRGAFTVLPTMLFRNVPLERHPHDDLIAAHDKFTNAQLGGHGGAVWIGDLHPVVYRKHPGGSWSSQDPAVQRIRHVESAYWIADWLFTQGDAAAGRDVLRRAARRLADAQGSAGVPLRVRRARRPAPSPWWRRALARGRRQVGRVVGRPVARPPDRP